MSNASDARTDRSPRAVPSGAGAGAGDGVARPETGPATTTLRPAARSSNGRGVSISNIAKSLGISHVTVSRALNDPTKVNAITLARIRKACSEASFTPRVIPNRLKTVSLIVPSSDDILVGDSVLISKIVALLSGRNYHVVVSSVDGIEQLSVLFQKAFIAILRDVQPEVLPLIRRYAARSPFVTINDMNEEVGPDAVLLGSDHRQGISMAMEHFLSRGHTRIGYVATSLKPRGHRERLEAYRQIMKAKGLYDDSLVFVNDEQLLPEGLRRLCWENVTGLLVTEAQLTPRVLYYLKLIGKEVPRDVSLITHELAGGYQFVYPPITSVVQPGERLAELAVDTVLGKLLNPDLRVEHAHYLPYELVIRESVRSI
ncbi:MAG: LacI family DNA-binding transcriptional regulator [Phycisphaeraceae bacterium]